MLLWGCFLPWDRHFSLQRVQAKFSERWMIPHLWIFQIILIYVFSFVAKLFEQDWVQGRALSDALQIEHLQTSFGVFLKELPQWVLKVANWSALLIEGFLAPIAVFLPRKWRNLIVLLVISFHLVIAFTFLVSSFSPLMIALWVSLYLPQKDQQIFRLNGRKSIFALAVSTYLSAVNIAFLLRPYDNVFWNPFTQLFRLDQSWLMFDSPKDQLDGWISIQEEKTGADLLHRNIPLGQKPTSIEDWYSSHRWLKWWMNTARAHPSTEQGSMRYACNLATSENRSDDVKIIFFQKVEGGYASKLLNYFYCN